MKIVAIVVNANCQGESVDDNAAMLIEYSCGDRLFSSSVTTVVDLTRTESEIREDIRTTVSDAVNVSRGLSTTSADVRLFA
jgi:hypothetical protein